MRAEREHANTPNAEDLPAMVRRLLEERKNTNAAIEHMAKQMKVFEEALSYMGQLEESDEVVQRNVSNRELALSALDRKVLEFVQSSPSAMVCAEDLMKHMNYKGKNAACARLMRLCKEGLLDRVQLGHRVYYKFDAGKTTNTLIISPPQ